MPNFSEQEEQEFVVYSKVSKYALDLYLAAKSFVDAKSTKETLTATEKLELIIKEIEG